MKMRLVLVLLILIGACSSAQAFDLGVCTHLGQRRGDWTTIRKLMSGAGVNSFRDDVFWPRYQSESTGDFSMPVEAESLRALIDSPEIKSSLLILAYGNKRYDNGGLVLSDEGRKAFGAYASYVTNAFRKTQLFEVWNEWSSGFGSNPRVQHGPAAAYVRLLQETYSSVKQVNPDARVIAGAVAGTDVEWTRSFVAAGGVQSMDAYSVHPYTLFKFRDAPEVAFHGLDIIEEVLSAAAGRPIPIYLSEIGWPTYQGKMGVSEDKQSDYLARFLFLARARQWISGVWIYDLIDDGNRTDDMEDHFGLVRSDLSLKPAYSMLKSVSGYLTSGVDFSVHFSPPGYYMISFNYKGAEKAVAWRVEKMALEAPEVKPYRPGDFSKVPSEMLAQLDAKPEGKLAVWRKKLPNEWVLEE